MHESIIAAGNGSLLAPGGRLRGQRPRILAIYENFLREGCCFDVAAFGTAPGHLVTPKTLGNSSRQTCFDPPRIPCNCTCSPSHYHNPAGADRQGTAPCWSSPVGAGQRPERKKMHPRMHKFGGISRICADALPDLLQTAKVTARLESWT